MKPYLIDLKKYEDTRGEFYESFKIYFSHHLNFTVMQENTCKSKKNVLRRSQKKMSALMSGPCIRTGYFFVRVSGGFKEIWWRSRLD